MVAAEKRPRACEPGDTPDARLRAALDLCRASLHDFAPYPEDQTGFAQASRPATRVNVPAERLPVPGSVALVMRLLLDAHSLARAEKLTWEFPFTFRGRPCSIASEKFGLRLYLGEDPAGGPDAASDSAAVARTVVSKLSAAVRCLERHVLSVLGTEQVAEGNLTIHNQAGRLRSTYEYFRRLATEAYAGRGILARDYDERSDRTPFLDRFPFVAEQTEGLDAAMAMTVACWSTCWCSCFLPRTSIRRRNP